MSQFCRGKMSGAKSHRIKRKTSNLARCIGQKERAVDIVRVVSKYASSLVLFEVSQPRSCTFKELRSLIPSKFKGEIIDFDLDKVAYYLSNLEERTDYFDNWIYIFDRRHLKYPSWLRKKE